MDGKHYGLKTQLSGKKENSHNKTHSDFSNVNMWGNLQYGAEIWNVKHQLSISRHWAFLVTSVGGPGNHDASWVLGSKFSVPDLHNSQDSSPWAGGGGSLEDHLSATSPLVPLPAQPGQSEPSPFLNPPYASRVTRIQPCCHCWPPLYLSLGFCPDQRRSAPSMISLTSLLPIHSVFSFHHSPHCILDYNPNTLPYPRLACFASYHQRILRFSMFLIAY